MVEVKAEMKCRKADRLLFAYLEDLLSTDERSELSDHLSRCENCRLELEEIRATGKLLQENRRILRPAYQSYSLAGPVVDRVFAESDDSSLLRRLVRKPVAVGLTALMVAIFSYLIGYISRPAFDNNDIQFYLESYNQVSGVEIIAFGEPEER
jgi:hypothetical protein